MNLSKKVGVIVLVILLLISLLSTIVLSPATGGGVGEQCYGNSQCGYGGLCNNGICISCTRDGYCYDGGYTQDYTCLGGKCLSMNQITCDSTNPCPSGMVCENGECKLKSGNCPGPSDCGCASSSSCSSITSSGGCDNTREGWSCASGRACATYPSASLCCAISGTSCSIINGVDSCCSGLRCSGIRNGVGACEEIPPPCTSNADCGSLICGSSGSCIPCSSDSQCESGNVCSSSRCTSPTYLYTSSGENTLLTDLQLERNLQDSSTYVRTVVIRSKGTSSSINSGRAKYRSYSPLPDARTAPVVKPKTYVLDLSPITDLGADYYYGLLVDKDSNREISGVGHLDRFTLQANVYFDPHKTPTGYGPLFAEYYGGYGEENKYYLHLISTFQGNEVLFHSGDNEANTDSDIELNTDYHIEKWVNFAVVVDKSAAQQVKLYMDGKKFVAPNPIYRGTTSLQTQTRGAPLMIGMDNTAEKKTTTADYLGGYIDNVKIYKRALTEKEILSSISPTEKQLIDLRFEDNLQDSISRNNAEFYYYDPTNPTPTSTRTQLAPLAYQASPFGKSLVGAVKLPENAKVGHLPRYTISAWVYLDSATGWDSGTGSYPIISEYNGGYYGFYYLRISPTKIFFHPNNNNLNLESSGSYDKKWTHVAVVIDRTVEQKQMRLYVNGVLAQSRDNAPEINLYNQDAVRSLVGADEWMNYPRFFAGKIDNVRIYNYPRTTKQIWAEANSLDSDSDGLSDADEATRGTDPNDSDSDNDGIPDGVEVSIGSNPLNPDQNGNGIPDGQEDWDRDGTPNSTDSTPGNPPASPGGTPPTPDCTTTGCPSGQTCNPTTKICETSGVTPGEEGTGEEGDPCSDSTMCGENLVCGSEGCEVPTACTTQSECDTGEDCNSEKVCEVHPCDINNDCSTVGGVCNVATSTCHETECGTDTPCSEGKTCDEGRCLDCTKDSDADNVKDCEDLCPQVIGNTETECHTKDNVPTCTSIGGVECTGGECIDSTSKTLTNTRNLNCCVPLTGHEKDVLCDPGASYVAALGRAVTFQKGICVDEDGDGEGSVAVKLVPTSGSITLEDIEEIGITGGQLNSAGTEASYAESCTTLPQDYKGPEVPFYNYTSMILTGIVLALFYWKRKLIGIE